LTVCVAFVRSYEKMLAVDPGFRPDHVLVAGYQLPAAQYANATAIAAFDRAVVERLSTQSGVAAVGITNALPDEAAGAAAYTVEGVPLARWKLQFAPFYEVYGDYLQSMRISLLAGRYFTARDRWDAPLVAIVNQSMARHAWPGQSPVGKRLHIGNPSHRLPWVTVVGVVADTHIGAPDQPTGDQWYFPMEQPEIINGNNATGMVARPYGYIVLRSKLPPEEMVAVLRATVASIDPQLALDPVRPMSEALSRVEEPRRFNTGVISAFALAALLLAAMGIYAVVAFSVSLRRHEIAIRMALGAQRGSIARLILSGGAGIALAGCSMGVLASLGAARVVRSLLFGVSATDPWIYAGCFAAMVLLAVLASAVPAKRAAAADPAQVLRAG
ncbi:MAG TPA: FtsX-like permease family protein, partial [Acidobacteriaceae bacterium]|nr:FtsX-like permease family protein [Acidobacteriaceae bacterium]